MKHTVILLIVLFVIPAWVYSQCPESSPLYKTQRSGKLFYLTFMEGANADDTVRGEVILVSLKDTARIEITCKEYPSYKKTFVLAPNSSYVYLIGTDINNHIVGSEYVTNRIVKVTSSVPIMCYGSAHRNYVGDLFVGVSEAAAGMEYTAVTYRSLTDPPTGISPLISIAAFENGTQVTITPTERTLNLSPKGIPLMYLLDSGQGVQIEAERVKERDLTSTRISSTKPIAVYAGHNHAEVLLNDRKKLSSFINAGYHFESIPPVSTWGKNYVFQSKMPSDTFEVIRVLSLLDNTTVSLNGVPWDTPFNANEYRTKDLRGTYLISSDKPILVADYSFDHQSSLSTSNPPDTAGSYLAILPSLEQTYNEFTFYSYHDSGFFRNLTNWVQIVTARESINSITIDGNPVPSSAFTDVPGLVNGKAYSVGSVRVQPGRHTVFSPGVAEHGFVLMVYGQGNYGNHGYGYGYGAGAIYKPLRGIIAVEEPPRSGIAADKQQPKVRFRNIVPFKLYLDSLHIYSDNPAYHFRTKERVWDDISSIRSGEELALTVVSDIPVTEPVSGKITLHYHGADWRNLEPVEMPFTVYPTKALSAAVEKSDEEITCSIVTIGNGSFLLINSPIAQEASIMITDILGKTITLNSLLLTQGGQHIGFTNHHLPSGVYMVSIKTEKSTVLRKVIK